MAANKFATMLHRHTNRITIILVYVLLEWTLIALLLMNSLLSYMIIKFADYFGLKAPCFWCSRIDHFLEPQKGDNFPKDLLCEAHATEISKMGYCRNHQKLASYQNMCEDCSSSRPDFCGVSKNFSMFSWVEKIGMIHDDADKVFDDGVVSLRCSCCDVCLEKQLYSPYVLECKEKENMCPYEEENDNLPKKEESLDRIGSDFLVDDYFRVDHEVESKNEDQMLYDVNGGYSLIEGKSDEDSDCSVSVCKFGLEELKGGDEDEVDMLLEGETEVCEEEDLSKVMEDLISDEIMSRTCRKEEGSLKIHPEHLEFFIDFSGHQLVPIELTDSSAEDTELITAEETQKYSDLHEKDGFEVDLVVETMGEKSKFAVFESLEMEETENSLVFYAKESSSEYQNSDNSGGIKETVDSLSFHAKETFTEYANVDRSMDIKDSGSSLVYHAKESHSDYENDDITLAAQNSSRHIGDVQGIVTDKGGQMQSNFSTVCENVSHVDSKESELNVLVASETAALDAEHVKSYVPAVSGEESHIVVNETEVEISIGTEIPDLDSTDENQAQDTSCLHEDPSTNSANVHEDDHLYGIEIKLQQEETFRLGNLAIEISENLTNNQLSVSTESNGTDEEKIPDTPTSFDTFHHLHKKLLLLDRKESGTEESLDGSLISDFESGDGVMTVERLTSALRAERKALHVLYAELEEERSASAVAANQTMAMINRLQEEKAAMHMEALQYQRMMEEQSEYDQEALQLLNELMLKREREKQELEKELDTYRKKVTDYEAKEKMRMLRRSKDGSARSGFSSTSFSNGEDSDGISIDLYQEVKEEDGFYSHEESGNHNTPVNTVLHLGDSFGEFEEERMSILEQLKALEDKLFTLSEDEHLIESERRVKQFPQVNGNHSDDISDFSGGEYNGYTNGYSKEMNGKHHQEGRITGAKAKRLLPLFDAITADDENGELNDYENGFESVVTRFELEERRVAIEEEVDQLYARMHALETDKEFLKHCISSLKKGDKGIELLGEILQHLRELRNMELRAKEFTDGTLG